MLRAKSGEFGLVKHLKNAIVIEGLGSEIAVLRQQPDNRTNYRLLTGAQVHRTSAPLQLLRVHTPKEPIQPLRALAQLLLDDGRLPQQALLLDGAILQDNHQQRYQVLQRKHLEMLQGSLRGARRRDHRRALQGAREYRSGQPHPLIKLVLNLIELMA